MCRPSASRGSSPRMRGKLDVARIGVEAGRIIPAHAGQTSVRVLSNCSWADHPRACGANRIDVIWIRANDGSSPRMRGKPRGRRCGARPARIIPAHAGQTPLASCRVAAKSDHPRACGANVVGEVCDVAVAGSSPRMRGKQRQFQSYWQTARIIPAHAGQTSAHSR